MLVKNVSSLRIDGGHIFEGVSINPAYIFLNGDDLEIRNANFECNQFREIAGDLALLGHISVHAKSLTERESSRDYEMQHLQLCIFFEGVYDKSESGIKCPGEHHGHATGDCIVWLQCWMLRRRFETEFAEERLDLVTIVAGCFIRSEGEWNVNSNLERLALKPRCWGILRGIPCSGDWHWLDQWPKRKLREPATHPLPKSETRYCGNTVVLSPC